MSALDRKLQDILVASHFDVVLAIPKRQFTEKKNIIAFHSPGKAKMWKAPALGTVFLLNTVHQESKYWDWRLILFLNIQKFDCFLNIIPLFASSEIWLDIQIGSDYF